MTPKNKIRKVYSVKKQPKLVDKEDLYKRARESSMDLVKFTLTMATTILGVFFITLTKKGDKELTPDQKTLLHYATWLMVLSVASGLAGWAFHSLFYAAWAGQRYKTKTLWRRGRKFFFFLFIILFILGIILSGKYIIASSL